MDTDYWHTFHLQIDKEEKKWRAQQEGPRPHRLPKMLQLLAMRAQGQGNQAVRMNNKSLLVVMQSC